MLRRIASASRAWMMLAPMAMTLGVLAQPTLGQCEIGELLASDGTGGDYFGRSVAINGDIIIVGAADCCDPGDDTGSAYIFQRDGSSWIEQAKLLASDGAEGDEFGISVGVSGNLAIVGAQRNDENGFVSGAAYIFKYIPQSNEWVEQAKLLASDGAAGDLFGFSVDICGDFAVVGAHRHDIGNSDNGAAYLFQTSDDGQSWTEVARLWASDGLFLPQRHGISVAIDDDLIVVGAYWAGPKGSDSGAAYVYRIGDNIPNLMFEEDKLLPADGEAGDRFGSRVAIDADRCVVGAFGDSDNGSGAGAAYVFRYDNDAAAWIEEAKLLAIDGESGDEFATVAIQGEVVVVGATKHDLPVQDAGAAYVFMFDPQTERWNDHGKLTASDNASYDFFGSGVAISNGKVVVGAYRHDDLGSSSGSAYVFDALAETDANNNGIPDACEPGFGDLNSDGVVGAADVVILLAFWGPCPPPPIECLGDLNADGVVSAADLLILLANWS